MTLVMSLVFQRPALAENMVVAGTELPKMVFRVCPTLAAARTQAARSQEYSKVDHESVKALDFLFKGCDSLDIVVVPLSIEESIRVFETWTVAFDRTSSRSFNTEYRGQFVTITYSIRRQPSRYWLAEFRHPNGDWYMGWVEIPDEPYLLKWAAEQSR